MAPKSFYLFIFLFLSYVSIETHAKSHNPKAPKPSPFEFINHLQGCHKGEVAYMISKQTLRNLAISIITISKCHAPKSLTDSKQALNQLETPTDIVNGTNYMRASANKHDDGHGNNSIHTVSHYSFFPNNPKWPASQTHLTYAFAPNTNTEAVSAVAKTFNTWASAAHFTFSHGQVYSTADIKVSFHRGAHGDGYLFDGRGGTIAHAFAPTDGRFHYDADERWAVGAVQGLETAALHEIGHFLGLGHSSVQDAIMFASIDPGVTKGLHGDDIQGIKALYRV